MIAAYRILLHSADGGQDLTPLISGRTATGKPRLINLVVVDNPGGDADELTLTLDDGDNGLALPPTGAVLSVAIGWLGRPLIDKGRFRIDEVSHDGPPAQLRIKGRSGDVAGSLTERREQSYDQVPVTDLVTTLAARNGLVAAISPRLPGITLPHVDQTNESDANLLSRLGAQQGFIWAVKADKLLVLPTGTPESAGGQPLATARLERRHITTWRYTATERGQYTGVRVAWEHVGIAAQESILVGDDSGAVHTLRSPVQDAETARAAARAELTRINQGAARLTLELDLRAPDIIAEQPVVVAGIKSDIDDAEWQAARITHTLDGNGGYSRSLECGLAGAEDNADSEE